MYGRDSVMSTVGQHGSFNAGIVHLHHEGPRDARAFLYPQRGLRSFILRSDTHASSFMIKTMAVRVTHTHLCKSYPTDGTVPDVVPCASTAKTCVVRWKPRTDFHVIA